MNFRQIMDEVAKIKGMGNRLFKEGKYDLAKAKYDHVLQEFNHVNPQDDEGKEFSETRNLLNLNVAACYLKMGESSKSLEACNKVLDANPVHVKALYRRGMAYMSAGNFEEARADFNKEVHIRARRQFKGLFDKKPGLIFEAGDIDTQQISAEMPEIDNRDDLDGDSEHLLHANAPPPWTNLWSRLWPTSRRLFTALGLDRCTIL